MNGAWYFVRGFAIITRPGIRAYVVIPLLINTALFAALIYFGSSWLGGLVDRMLPDWLDFLRWLLVPAFVLSALIAGFYTFNLVANLVAAPFNNLLAEAVERHLTGRSPRPAGEGWRSLIAEIATTFMAETRKFVYVAVRTLPPLLLFLVPGLNVLATVLWMLLGAWMLAITYVGLSNDEPRNRLRRGAAARAFPQHAQPGIRRCGDDRTGGAVAQFSVHPLGRCRSDRDVGRAARRLPERRAGGCLGTQRGPRPHNCAALRFFGIQPPLFGCGAVAREARLDRTPTTFVIGPSLPNAWPSGAKVMPAELNTSSVLDFKPYKPKRGEEYMNDEQTAHFRGILLDWKRMLMEEVDRTLHHMQDEAANFPDPNDRATQESEFTLELRTRDRERKLIRKIDEAIVSLENGDYGFCEACGIEIGIRRLEARPTATLCYDCKVLDEIREKQMG